jgi:type II secretory pathway component PulJ
VAVACAGILLAIAVPARLSWCTIRTLSSAARKRRRHGRGLALIGRLDRNLGAVVVDHREPYVLAVRLSHNVGE